MWGNHVGILVVDDCQPFRDVVCSLLHKNRLFEILAEADDGLEAIRHAQRLQPDLVLLDIGLPRLNGIEVARRIRELAPDSKILFLTQETDPEVIQEAMSLGALSYVVKSKAESELLPSIELIFRSQDVPMRNFSLSWNPHQNQSPSIEEEHQPATVPGHLAERRFRRSRNPSKRWVALLRRLAPPSRVRRPSQH
jgi:DNA-binding NarL/FixJ family response regulator